MSKIAQYDLEVLANRAASKSCPSIYGQGTKKAKACSKGVLILFDDILNTFPQSLEGRKKRRR